MKGLKLTNDPSQADLVLVSEDTPTDKDGNRDLDLIRNLVLDTFGKTMGPIILTSQVPPGFTRSLQVPLYHYAETLRVKDALERALTPEQHIVGCLDPVSPLPVAFRRYLEAFPAPILKMSYESAEFAKIAINLTLASQVENTNRLCKAAIKCGADWGDIAEVLGHDRRIGKYSYLTPGDWRASKHLLRDWRTYEELTKVSG
jgi:UDPglucose 6-dehydrogenase